MEVKGISSTVSFSRVGLVRDEKIAVFSEAEFENIFHVTLVFPLNERDERGGFRNEAFAFFASEGF